MHINLIRKIFGLFLLLIVAIFQVPQLVYAQENGLIRVVAISGDDGTPLAGANVLLYDQNSNLNLSNPELFCVTNRDGLCEIRNIPPNREFELRISFVGFITHSELIILKDGERHISRIILDPDLEQFDEVVVEQQRYITTGEVGVRRISNIDISRVPSPVAGGDLASYLQTVPGIVSSGDRGGDLYIRGGTPDQNMILVDRLHIVKPFHISNLFSAFPDGVVQNADLYAGGFDSKYVGATSAVIDIGLRPGNMRYSQISAAASPYLSAIQAEGPIEADRQSILFSGRISTIDRFAPALTGSELPIQFGDLLTRYTIQGDNVTCNLTGIYTYDSGEIVPGREVIHTWSNMVIGGRCLGFSEFFNHPVDLSVGYTSYQNEEGTSENRERYSAISQLYFNLDLQQEIFGLAVDYGFGANFRTYNVELSERFTSASSLRRVIPIISLYSSVTWEPHRKVVIKPGFASQITLDTPVTFEPRLRVSWQPQANDRRQVSFAAGKYVQTHSGISDERDAGTVFTILQPVQTDDPLPESLHGILAYQHRIGSYLTANVEGFVKTHKNIPVSKWTPEARTEIETALAQSETFGFDFRLRYDRSPLYLSLGYGWSKVEYEAISGDLGAWIREPIFRYSPAHDQRHKLNTLASYTFSGFTLNAGWEFGTGMPFTQIFGYDFSIRVPDQSPQSTTGTARIIYSEPYNKRLPYYHRLDISMERKFNLLAGSTLETQAGVINAYNRNNIFNFDFSTLQRVDQTPLLPYISLKLNL